MDDGWKKHFKLIGSDKKISDSKELVIAKRQVVNDDTNYQDLLSELNEKLKVEIDPVKIKRLKSHISLLEDSVVIYKV